MLFKKGSSGGSLWVDWINKGVGGGLSFQKIVFLKCFPIGTDFVVKFYSFQKENQAIHSKMVLQGFIGFT